VVHGEGRLEAGGCDAIVRAGDARVVHKNVDLAQFLQRSGNQRLNAVLVTQVAGNRNMVAT
jgi:uncharacterized cupin superfamily protein